MVSILILALWVASERRRRASEGGGAVEPASPEVLLSRKAALQLCFPTPGQTAPLLVSAPPPMLRGEQSWAGGCKLGFVWLGPASLC